MWASLWLRYNSTTAAAIRRRDFLVKYGTRIRLFALIAIAMLPIVGFRTYDLSQYQRRETNSAFDRSLTLARAGAREIGELYQQASSLIELLSEVPFVANSDPAACEHLLNRAATQQRQPLDMFVTDSTGVVTCANNPDFVGIDLTDRLYVRQALFSGDVVVSDFLVLRNVHRPGFTVSRAVRNATTGEPIGVIGTSMDLAVLSALIEHVGHDGETSTLLIDRAGTVLSRVPDAEETFAGYSIAETDFYKAIVHGGEGRYAGPGPDGVARFGAFTTIAKSDAKIFVGFTQDSVLAYARTALVRSLWQAAVLLVAAALLAFVGGKLLLLRWIERLTAVAAQLGRGDFSARAAIPSSAGDLALVGHALDDACERLAERERQLRATERKLRESESRYRLLADNASDMIVQTSLGFRREYVSPASRQLLGRSPEEMVKSAPLEFIHPDDVGLLIETVDTVARGERDKGLARFRLLHRKGHWVWVESHFRGYRSSSGELAGLIASIRDITERHREQEALADAKMAAEAAARHSAEFLATMSHELRTPLTGMLGVQELLQSEPGFDDRQRHLIRLSCEAGRSLMSIVNDILDLSKIEAEQLKIERIPFLVRDLVEGCRLVGCESVKPGVTIVVDIAPDVPVCGMGDPARIRQVLLNLLSNACRFTVAGSITIRLAWTADRLRVEVIDTGPGIAPDVVPTLFQRFQQGDRSTARRFGGTGLGLSISKRLVGLMDGAIGVDTHPGRGAVFWFELPLAVADPLSARDAEAHPAEGTETSWRILLAEDNQTNREIIRTLLEQRGYVVTAVPDGTAAVAAFRQGTFDVVLMDVAMPGLDGCAATALIHKIERTAGRAPTPIVALTAGAMAEDRERCLKGGMDDYLCKPIDWPLLFRVVDRLASRRSVPTLRGAICVEQTTVIDEPVLDESVLDELAGVLGHDRIGDFLELLRCEARRVPLLHDRSDAQEETIALAHQLAAAAGQLGFKELSAICRGLESRLRSGVGLVRTADLEAATERAIVAASTCRYAKAGAGAPGTAPSAASFFRPRSPADAPDSAGTAKP
ncbi:MAG: response regulator [Rhodoplanes sp.]|uniref:ATP-binding protein n=1 Tax=Rhodoplanes sp. TaxID=1968906 RepID=UPI00182F4836|nr:ATP-binding protein [Rhodoplanes sp.]NVO17275.1 response regulator [Rhodoplanes sp.]